MNNEDVLDLIEYLSSPRGAHYLDKLAELIEKIETTRIPAQPGWAIVYEEGDFRDEIIAWSISKYSICPITSEEVIDDLHENWAIASPGGTYSIPMVGTYKTLEDCQNDLRDRREQSEARRSALREKKAVKGEP